MKKSVKFVVAALALFLATHDLSSFDRRFIVEVSGNLVDAMKAKDPAAFKALLEENPRIVEGIKINITDQLLNLLRANPTYGAIFNDFVARRKEEQRKAKQKKAAAAEQQSSLCVIQ